MEGRRETGRERDDQKHGDGPASAGEGVRVGVCESRESGGDVRAHMSPGKREQRCQGRACADDEVSAYLCPL